MLTHVVFLPMCASSSPLPLWTAAAGPFARWPSASPWQRSLPPLWEPPWSRSALETPAWQKEKKEAEFSALSHPCIPFYGFRIAAFWKTSSDKLEMQFINISVRWTGDICTCGAFRVTVHVKAGLIILTQCGTLTAHYCFRWFGYSTVLKLMQLAFSPCGPVVCTETIGPEPINVEFVFITQPFQIDSPPIIPKSVLNEFQKEDFKELPWNNLNLHESCAHVG